MNTSEVLNKAADSIEQYGHMKGAGYGDGPLETAPACTIGAINRAAWDDAGNINDDLALSTQGVFRNYLPERGIVDWNDAPERTASEVVEAFRAAAVIEAAREDQDAAWATYAEVVR